MRIVITGASGLIGSALGDHLAREGHRVDRTVRGRPSSATGEIFWDPQKGEIDAPALEDAAAVVHLAGENVGKGRWTRRRKEAIQRSRVEGTRLLSEALAGLDRPPRVLVSASALGYYGPGEEDFMEEDRPPGKDFLGEVCRRWEAAAALATQAGIRVAIPRIGVVLSSEGGALSKMLKPFRMGLGGRVGRGTQYMSWITLEDQVRALHHLIVSEVSGPVNTVAPNPVPQVEFARILAKVLKRPAFVPIPAFAVKVIFGEMGQALLLDGARLSSTKLLASGYEFRSPFLEEALRNILGLKAAL